MTRQIRRSIEHWGFERLRTMARSQRRPYVSEDTKAAAQALLEYVSYEVRRFLPENHPWRHTTGVFYYEDFLNYVAHERDEAAAHYEHLMNPVMQGRTDAEHIALDLVKRSAAGAYAYRMAEDHLLRAYVGGEDPQDVLNELRFRWAPMAGALRNAFVSDSTFGAGVLSAVVAVDSLLSDELSAQLPRDLHVQFIREDLHSRARIFAVSYGRKAQALNVRVDIPTMTNAAYQQRIISDISLGEAAIDAVWLKLFHSSNDLRELLLCDAGNAPQPFTNPTHEPHIDAAFHIEALAGPGNSVYPLWPLPISARLSSMPATKN